MAEIHPRTAPAIGRPVERLTVGALVLLAALLLSLVPAAAALAAKPRAASLTAAAPTVTGVTPTSAKLRVSGTVKLPSNLANTAKNRSKVRVAVTLQDAKRKKQSFTVKIDAKRKYAVTKATTLRGTLTVRAQTRVGGKPSGKVVTKKVTVKAGSSSTGSGSEVGSGPGSGGGSATPNSVPAGAERLIGVFRFDEGVSHADGSVTGTYFRMLGPGGHATGTDADYLTNGSSRSRNPTYTLLRPGTDGGLRTDAYQEPPTPLYDSSGVLASRIVQRERFYGLYFTVFTQSTDAAAVTLGEPVLPTPIPEIYAKDGKLTGQTTAWTANWNGGGLFNQGSPKPDGTSPGFTEPVGGTYDPATRRFVLEWTSRIVGGPFNSFGGYWHLTGTFVPSTG